MTSMTTDRAIRRTTASNSPMIASWSRPADRVWAARSSAEAIVIRAVLNRAAYALAVSAPNPARRSEAMPASTTGIIAGKAGPWSRS